MLVCLFSRSPDYLLPLKLSPLAAVLIGLESHSVSSVGGSSVGAGGDSLSGSFDKGMKYLLLSIKNLLINYTKNLGKSQWRIVSANDEKACICGKTEDTRCAASNPAPASAAEYSGWIGKKGRGNDFAGSYTDLYGNDEKACICGFKGSLGYYQLLSIIILKEA